MTELLEILQDVVRLLTFQLRDPDYPEQRRDQSAGRRNRRSRR